MSTARRKNVITRELEPLRRGRSRSLGDARRELRQTHAVRLALAAELGIDPTGLAAWELDALILMHEATHAPTER